MAKKQQAVKPNPAPAEDLTEAYPDHQPKQAVKEVSKAASNDPNRMVRINVPVRVNINDKSYYGVCEVPAHVAETILPMVSRKVKSDLRVFTGKNYLVQKLADNSLSVVEGDIAEKFKG